MYGYYHEIKNVYSILCLLYIYSLTYDEKFLERNE